MLDFLWWTATPSGQLDANVLAWHLHAAFKRARQIETNLLRDSLQKHHS